MGALSGIRVVEFEGWIAGPLLGMLLADQGADVVRIARPGPPIYDQPGASMLGRGKRSIVLDLKDKEDRNVALKIASSADIVIENLRPSALQRLDIGYDNLRCFNSKLIHVQLPGFASDDAEHEGLAAYEGIISASLGIFTEMNLLKPLFGMDPVYSPLALPSIYGAIQGAIACNAALLAREKSGVGARLEIPLAAAAAMAMSSIYMDVEGAPAHYETPKLSKPVKSVALPLFRRYLKNSPSRQYEFYQKIKSAVPAMMSAYVCSDGRLLYIFAIDNARLAKKLLETLGLLEQAKTFGLEVANPYDSPPEGSNLGATANLPRKVQAWLRKHIEAALLCKPADEWENIFATAGLPSAVVRTTDEWIKWPPLRDCEAVISGTHGHLQPGRQCWFSGEKYSSIGSEPTRNQHSIELRAEAKHIKLSKVRPIKSDGPPWQPLAGLKVLDFSSMVAGPVAGRTLSELGAEVLKIESPSPHHGPRMTCWYGLDVNQGKQSILIDLKSVDGQNILRKLAEDADIVLHNFTSPAAARLKLDRSSLAQVNPNILVCEIAAYAGPVSNPIDTRHGYDPVLQMASGIAARYGSLEDPELHGIASCIDNLTGYSMAFGIVAALASNARDGNICSVKTSLVQAANLIQFPFSSAPRLSEPTGQRAMGENEQSRIWRTRDGWIFTAPSGLQGSADFDTLVRNVNLESICSKEALELLRKTSIAAVAVNRAADVRESLRMVRREIDGLIVTQIEPDYLRINGERLPSISSAEKPGASTRLLLERKGFSESAIQTFETSASVAFQLSEKFLP